ncbi:MAG: helix-hairpin-helix domain-containing protein [Candidatus Cloacimonadales bacterium]|nr:helix-hairpin-helix domain-containing protein [Candidatus Cloacimonadales bacterium]
MGNRILIILLLLPFLLLAEDAEEKIFSLEEETFHANETSEILETLRKNPLNINQASASDLQKLPWLSEEDIHKIVESRKQQEISNWQDLENIGISSITISDIMDYIIFKPKEKLKYRQSLRFELNEAKENFPSTLKYYQRIRLDYGKFQSGFLTQKDEGETDLLDFYSYHLSYSGAGIFQKTIIGKYRLGIGQGLIFAPKLGLSKSAEATTIPVKKYNLLRPYTSSYEIWEMQGISTDIRLGDFQIIPFVSRSALSANLDSTGCITSFNEGGLHLDETKKNNVRETLFGSAVQYDFFDHQVGFCAASFDFNHNFADPEMSAKYTAGSFNFLLNRSSYPIFGEFAAIDAKLGGVMGAKFGENSFRQLILVRYYEKGIPTWQGNPFSTQSNFENETGIYYGITLLPFVRNKINCYFDVWSFPETRYFEKMPTVGSDQFLQWESHFETNSLRATVQHKSKEKYISLDDAKIRDFERTLLRLDWWQKLNTVTLKTRGEFVSEFLPEDKVYTSGYLMYEQLKWQSKKLEFITQVTVYRSDTSPFKVKHYVYENNVDGVMQNSVLSGDGIASYLLVKYKLGKNLELQFKISDEWQVPARRRLFFQIIGSW